MATKKTTNVKKRNWAFVLYPESAPKDWKEQLKLSGVQIAISPLHDKDVNPDGEPKKPHFHVIAIYGNPTTYNNVKALCDKLKCPIPQPLEQVKGYYRYLTHKDNPEKYQYDEKDIECLNGFSILDFCELSKSEIMQIKLKLRNLIVKNDIMEYSDLIDYCAENNLTNEFDVASSHTIFFNTFITSRRHKAKTVKESGLPKSEIKNLAELATGE